MSSAIPKRTRATIIWPKFGAYHLARLGALVSQSSIEVIGIEARNKSPHYQMLFDASSEHIAGSIITLSVPNTAPRKVLDALLTSTLSELAPDVIFVPGWSMAEAIVALDWSARTGTATVIMSDSILGDGSRSFTKESIKRHIVRLGGSSLVAGKRSADYIKSLGMPTERCFLGYDTVDNARFAEGALAARSNAVKVRQSLGLPEKYLLCCARLIPEKNLLTLLAAYRQYCVGAGEGAVPLVVVGPGPMEREIRQTIEGLDLNPHVVLKGAQPYEAMPAFYALAEAVILASISETWGLVVNEAMACGVPVLVSERCGCAPDLVKEGVNGFVFDPLDVLAMAHAIEQVTAPGCDRAAMGRAGQAIVADWGLERFVAGFEGAARAALAAPRRRASLMDRALLKALALR